LATKTRRMRNASGGFFLAWRLAEAGGQHAVRLSPY
jgi:hypothetical protein